MDYEDVSKQLQNALFDLESNLSLNKETDDDKKNIINILAAYFYDF